VIQLERVDLPDGLRALAYRDSDGNLVIYVSAGLDARQQRAAIMEAIRASRRAGWRRTGLLPVGIGLALGIRALLGRVGRMVATRPVAWGAATTAILVGAAAAGIFIASASRPHAPSGAGPPAGPGAAQPSGQQPGGSAPHRRQVRPVSVARLSPGPGRPGSSGSPAPAPTSPGGPSPTTPAPSPGPSPSPPGPLPSPSPSPSPPPPPPPSPAPSPTGSPGVCVVILGITVCLPDVSVR
jgi:hypothetical protein